MLSVIDWSILQSLLVIEDEADEAATNIRVVLIA